MVPEIDLLIKVLDGRKWDVSSQKIFMEALAEDSCFKGEARKDPAFSARDRITRAPKALGFVRLSPVISLTPAGKMLLESRRKEDVLLRQLMKFQIPSPYHKPGDKATLFFIKPYLEILRLIRIMGSLRFKELQLFGMQLTDWREFDNVVNKINRFRIDRSNHQGSYKSFLAEYTGNVLSEIYADNISKGRVKVRESNDNSIDKFLNTKARNLRDYADACVRYLRATGLVNVTAVGKSLSIVPQRVDEVDFILNTVDRNPVYVDSLDEYRDYLENPSLPILMTDSKPRIINKIKTEFPETEFDSTAEVTSLKSLYASLIEQRKLDLITSHTVAIRQRKEYDDIQLMFDRICGKQVYDPSLFLEWNTWRAMTMIDGGEIKANLVFDDFGKPMATAQGNMPDIVCDYGDFIITVKVSLTSGQRQFESESESVSRHLGKIKKTLSKPCYSLFIAPVINDASVAYFYGLHKISISYYGGKSVIVPLPLATFRKMLDDSHRQRYIPEPRHIQALFIRSMEIVESGVDEAGWFEGIKRYAATCLISDVNDRI